MALSNIGREPRREITESAVGILAVIIPVGLLYGAAVWCSKAGGGPVSLWMVTIFVGSILTTGVVSLLVMFTHWLGEVVCDFIAGRGLELRPKNRPEQDRRRRWG